MKEYIERAAAIEAIRKYQYPYGVEFLLSNIPAADVVEVRHGRWERRNMGLWDEDYAYVCSVCGEVWTLIDSGPARVQREQL